LLVDLVNQLFRPMRHQPGEPFFAGGGPRLLTEPVQDKVHILLGFFREAHLIFQGQVSVRMPCCLAKALSAARAG
jgi:hypothetical protein